MLYSHDKKYMAVQTLHAKYNKFIASLLNNIKSYTLFKNNEKAK